MRKSMLTLTVTLIAGLGIAAQQSAPPKPASKPATRASDQAKIKQAMSAAPAAIARNATIMDWPETPGGQMRELRAGTNGWTCMPSTPESAGASSDDPMCLDKTFLGWAEAWMAKKDPPQTNSVGIGYMLRGDKGASNTDPFATAATADNQWIVSPPHIMVVVPNPAQLDAITTNPDTGGPWVMWKGTKYAHVMMPTGTGGSARTVGTAGRK